MPNVSQVNSLDDLPDNALADAEGRIYTPELVVEIAAFTNDDPEVLAGKLGLQPVGVPNE
jgi:hypothetical protein